MKAALRCTYRTFYMRFEPNTYIVRSEDISSLDPWSEQRDVATWGGLTGFTSRLNDVVARAVNAGTEIQEA